MEKESVEFLSSEKKMRSFFLFCSFPKFFCLYFFERGYVALNKNADIRETRIPNVERRKKTLNVVVSTILLYSTYRMSQYVSIRSDLK